MGDAERWCLLAAGIVGLVALAVGSTLLGGPWVDRSDDEIGKDLAVRRTPILTGTVLSVAGAGLLLWPVAAVAVAAVSPGAGRAEAWRSLALFSVAAWTLGLGMSGVAAILVATAVWRGPTPPGPSPARALLDAAHLATWAVSAPIGAIAVVATTAVAVQADLGGPLLVLAAVAKVVTVGVEVAGTGRRSGWNAGGWAAGTSGYATVAWFAVLLAVLW